MTYTTLPLIIINVRQSKQTQALNKKVIRKGFSKMDYLKVGYHIQDNLGGFDCSIALSPRLDSSKMDWDYSSSSISYKWFSIKEDAEKKIDMLKELNKLAEFENISWKVVELTYGEYIELWKENYKKNLGLGMGEYLARRDHGLNCTFKDIKKGYIGKHKKLQSEIYNKYYPKKRRIA